MSLPEFKLRNLTVKYPIIQGGMGIGYSNYKLVGSVAREGGIGVLSSAGADLIVSKRHGRKFRHREAVAQDVRDSKIEGENGKNNLVEKLQHAKLCIEVQKNDSLLLVFQAF